MAVSTGDAALRSLLESGSSRVFNCNDVAKALLGAKDPNPYFFKSSSMNFLVLIKEALIDVRLPHRTRDEIVGTKLYFPYDLNDIYAGGRSIYFHDAKMQRVLREQLGGGGSDGLDIEHDLNVLGILDKLPSLDGFLMRDALEIQGIKCNPKYFDVSQAEHLAIRDFIRKKFDPLVRIAYSDQDNLKAKVSNLVEKIWDANDREALAPLIRAFRFPDDDALSIFAAWKGINFYSFQYVHGRPVRESFALWLRDGAQPKTYVPSSVLEVIDNLRRATVKRLRFHWHRVEQITRDYDGVYAGLLRGAEGAPAFVSFLNGSGKLYWQMGDSLSKISHATSCWKNAAQGHPSGKLPADDLEKLFMLLNQILVGEEFVSTDGGVAARVA
jgi:hypothetical protein